MAAFPDIATFAEQYGLAADDPEVVRAYEAAASAEQEYDSRQRHWERVKREAIEEGVAQGIEQERRRMVAALRERGVDEAVIASCMSEDGP